MYGQSPMEIAAKELEELIKAAESPMSAIEELAGVGRTTETVKGNADALAAHKADTAPHADATNLVKTSGSQTISGEKTFTAPLNVQNGKALDMYNPGLAVDANRYAFQVQENVLRLFALSSAGAWQRTLFEFAHNGNHAYFANGNIKLLYGYVAPEGSVTAAIGALYFKPSSPAKLYLKETGTGNTGWKELALV